MGHKGSTQLENVNFTADVLKLQLLFSRAALKTHRPVISNSVRVTEGGF